MLRFSMCSSSFSGFFVPPVCPWRFKSQWCSLIVCRGARERSIHPPKESLSMAQDHVLLCWSLTCPRHLGPHQSPYLPLMLFADGNLQDHVLVLLGAGFPAWLWLHFLPLFGCDALRNPLLGEPDLWPGDGSDMNFCPATIGIKSGLCPWLSMSSSEHSYFG